MDLQRDPLTGPSFQFAETAPSPLGFWHKKESQLHFLNALRATAHPHHLEKASLRLQEMFPDLKTQFDEACRRQVLTLTGETDVTEALQVYFQDTRPDSRQMRLLRRGAFHHLFVEKIENQFFTFWLDQRFQIQLGRLQPLLEALPLVFDASLELAQDRLQFARLTQTKLAVFVNNRQKIQGFRCDLKTEQGFDYFEVPELKADQELWFAILRNQVVLLDRRTDELYQNSLTALREILFHLKARNTKPDQILFDKLKVYSQLAENVYTEDRTLLLLLQEIRIILQKRSPHGFQDFATDLELL